MAAPKIQTRGSHHQKRKAFLHEKYGVPMNTVTKMEQDVARLKNKKIKKSKRDQEEN